MCGVLLARYIHANRSCSVRYLATFFHGIVSVSAICKSVLPSYASNLTRAILVYFPVYFQACLLSDPIESSVKILPTAIVSSSFSLFCGIAIKKMNKYRPANVLGWTLTIIGFGLLTLLKFDSPAGMWGGFQALQAAGSGTIVRTRFDP